MVIIMSEPNYNVILYCNVTEGCVFLGCIYRIVMSRHVYSSEPLDLEVKDLYPPHNFLKLYSICKTMQGTAGMLINIRTQ